ncbi:MAG: cytochrome c biogenesis protein CcmG/thiol:disulfide interchange protein DsbE [Rickettsiales bacterium]|jgi:cytochrome c biogenesis protein CcmG/thiol:disulfide interchange protein DsbE
MKKKFILASPFFLFLVVVLLGTTALFNGGKEGIEEKLRSGKEVMMPEFSLPELLDSKATISNSDLMGKYSLINVFASWCSVCAAENDLLMRIAKEGKIDVYGIAWRDIQKNTKQYLANNGNPYLKVGIDSRGSFSKLLSVSGTPESFLVDPNGRIVHYWYGAIDEEFFRKWHTQ